MSRKNMSRGTEFMREKVRREMAERAFARRTDTRAPLVETPSELAAVAEYFDVPISRRAAAFAKLTPNQQRLAKVVYQRKHFPMNYNLGE